MSKETIKKGLLRIKREIKGNNENLIKGWWFDDEEIKKAKKEGKLLTLDVDLGKFCDLKCGFCFANTQSKNNLDYVSRSTIRAKALIQEAAVLGCQSIKIVGAGEPLLFPKLLEILRYCQELNIVPIIFTAGHILGDDAKVKNLFGKENINSGLELAQQLFSLNCSVVVKYLSHNDTLQNQMVRKKDYAESRDRGLLNLIRTGFNAKNPTRLGVDCLLLRSNHREALSLFSFFNKLNIFCVINTSMDCGNTKINSSNPEVLSKNEALEIAMKLYQNCLRKKIPFDQRISPYFLSPVCSQLNHGLFVGDDNSVKACPGGPIIGTYKEKNLSSIWKNNIFRKCKIGHKCISRCGKTYYSNFEKRIKKSL